MTTNVRRTILRANALYIGVAGFAGVIFDIRGVLYGLGPQGRALANAPYAGIGFVEAHGLAVILAVLLWRARPDRAAHLTALAVVALLGTANLAFWQAFIAMDALMMGYVTTALHWTFVALNLAGAFSAQQSDAIGVLTDRHAGARL
jgi:hypothetical protein